MTESPSAVGSNGPRAAVIGSGFGGLAAKQAAQTFEALPAQLKTPVLDQRTRILAANGKTASIKLATKAYTTIAFKGFITGTLTSPVPVVIDLGNGQTFAIDLLLDDKGMFP